MILLGFFFIMNNNLRVLFSRYLGTIIFIQIALHSFQSRMHIIIHASATADNLIGGIDRRIHAKTPDIFKILNRYIYRS